MGLPCQETYHLWRMAAPACHRVFLGGCFRACMPSGHAAHAMAARARRGIRALFAAPSYRSCIDSAEVALSCITRDTACLDTPTAVIVGARSARIPCRFLHSICSDTRSTRSPGALCNRCAQRSSIHNGGSAACRVTADTAWLGGCEHFPSVLRQCGILGIICHAVGAYPNAQLRVILGLIDRLVLHEWSLPSTRPRQTLSRSRRRCPQCREYRRHRQSICA